MKKTFKIAAAIISCLMVLSLAPAAFAGTYDNEFKDAVFSELAVFDGSMTHEMRGFTASPDGKYLYGGYLQLDAKGLYRYDAKTGEEVGYYIDDDVSYFKGIGADDRGYVYLGVATPSNLDAVQFIILDSSLKEIYKETINIEGKVGINGCTVEKIGDRYLMYFITNYGPNYIYCYDVTDPKAPKLNNDFGKGGIVTLFELTGVDGADGEYLDVTPAGDIYMTINLGNGSKGDTVMKVSPDGKNVVMKTDVEEAYGIWVNDEYVLVSTYQKEESKVVVLNISDFSKVAEIGNMGNNSHYSGVALVNDKIYISDQGYNGGDRILVSSKLNISEVVIKAPTEDEVQAPEAAAQTSDEVLMIIAVMILSIAGVIVLNKKRT